MARLNISMNQPHEEAPMVPAPPAGDTDVKLLKLQDEMDLLKTSIKKLLIDIRDRLNEKDNPFLRTGGFPEKADIKAEDSPADEEEEKAEDAQPEEEKVPKPEEETFPAAGKTVQEELANMLRGKGKMPPVSPFASQKVVETPPAGRFTASSAGPRRSSTATDMIAWRSSSRPMQAWDISPTRWRARSAR